MAGASEGVLTAMELQSRTAELHYHVAAMDRELKSVENELSVVSHASSHALPY